jgi:Emfourin
MRIEITRHGGLAGIVLRGSVDTAQLAPAVARAAEAAVEELPFGRLPSAPRHADSFQYEITVLGANGTRSAILDEADVPEPLLPLLEAAAREGHVS